MTSIASGASAPDDWFTDFHHGAAARFWRAVGALTADADAALVARLLALPPGASVLDVPCGDGRITVRLARDHGLEAHGVDISAPEVEHARRQAAGQATFEVADMRTLATGRRFDGLVSWGNSFGYLTPADTELALRRFRAALAPGGRLVLESATVAESLLVNNGIADEQVHEFAGIRMTIANRYDPARSRLESELTFEESGSPPDVRRVAHHVHTTGEVVRMLRSAGFAEVMLRGPDGERPYAPGDAKVIAVAA